jgi:long-chain fatty acid transport protein
MIKRLTGSLCALTLMAAAQLSAGSLDTLSNQTASYFFSTAQTAATSGAGIIPYNPAGTALLGKGFYLEASNQTILKFYNESVDSAALSEDYSQNMPTPSLPSLSLAYNFGRIGPGNLAIYANGGICAGGGGLDWKDGTVGTNALVASVAKGLSAHAPTSAAAGSTTSLEASSVYYGLGAGLGYSFFDDRVSASAGVRYVMAERSGTVTGKLNLVTTTPGGNVPWTLGVDYDYTYSARGFTPIFGLDIRPVTGLTLGFRYEMETALEFEYDTDTATGTSSVASPTLAALAQGAVNNLNQDGQKVQQNLPQVFSFAAEYVFNPKLTVSAGTNLYFLGAADLDGVEDDFGVGYELNLAGQYQMTKKLLVGGTFMYSNQSTKDSYYEKEANMLAASANPPLDSLTFGLGGKYNLFRTLDVLLCGAYIHYIHVDATTETYKLDVNYKKDIVNLCIGASYKF